MTAVFTPSTALDDTRFSALAGGATIWGAPPGADAILLHQLQKAGSGSIIVTIDDAAMERLVAGLQLAGVAKDDLLVFPAWNCLPYDRVSPDPALIGRRMATLARLVAEAGIGRRILVTTVNAWIQRLPPCSFFSGASLSLVGGAEVSPQQLAGFFEANGWRRADTVREVGEYALRGGLIDVFPPHRGDPVRLDLFGNEIERIRRFDPASQRSGETLDRVTLNPVSEILLDEPTISRFRGGYLETFGAAAARDPLYLSVSEGRYHPGMEQWLPLFHEKLERLADFTGPARLVVDEQAEAALAQRREQIADFYNARLEAMEDADASLILRPLQPDRLYLSEQEQAAALESQHWLRLSRFAPPAADAEDETSLASDSWADAGGRKGPLFHGLKPTSAGQETATGKDANPSQRVAAMLAEMQGSGRVVLAAGSEGARQRLAELVGEYLGPDGSILPVVENLSSLVPGQPATIIWPIEDGFVLPGLAVITEQDIYGSRIARPQTSRRRRGDDFLREVSSLDNGDLVVHIDHGIGRYSGLETITTDGADHDCLLILYAGGDKLFLPVENIDLLSRYGKAGTDSRDGSGDAMLDKLGGVAWQARKARIKGRVRDIADQLIQLAAKRQLATAEPLLAESGSYGEFCQRFPFAETDDQLDTINDVLEDLRSGRVMDRLICGDVGFGKTEIALRAAFVAVMAGYQVAVVTPTTLLARQHGSVFRDRFKGFPVSVGVLSRMTSGAEAGRLKKAIANGDCQIAIGTHALLSKSMQFSNIGLLIVDEEQHFGVSQKERLKSLRGDVHVLTLSATPIPRTLQMALSGVREMSIIATPPVDRLAVRTAVGPWDPVILAEAVRRERFRGGQVFCVCPRISDLPRVHDRLLRMVPEARIITAHGQMPAAELDLAMTRFGEGEGDILLSTNIIESGIDIPSANTMIIHRADLFGLSQLYQLRGRVGRSRQRAYAYLTTDPNRLLTTAAKKRLQVMQTLDSLGAGFTLASYDLDIRGAGNLLGDEQSGHVREVGVELYQEMLREAVAEARSGDAEAAAETAWAPAINIGTSVLIPEAFVSDLTVRLSLYRRIGSTTDRDEINAIRAELIDRFGPLPEQVANLLDTIAIKALCRKVNIERLDAGPKGISMAFRDNRFARPEKLIAHIASRNGQIRLGPDHRLVIQASLPLSGRARAVHRELQELEALLADD